MQWSQEFSGMSGDLLTLEDQIYAKLVDALKVKATPSEMSVAGAHPTENVAAYDIYLHGRQALRGQQDPKNIQTAIDLFEQAIKMDSGFRAGLHRIVRRQHVDVPRKERPVLVGARNCGGKASRTAERKIAGGPPFTRAAPTAPPGRPPKPLRN